MNRHQTSITKTLVVLELKFIGNVTVLKDGKVLDLPQSKKTRALLGYLVLNNREFQRDSLCELLWEIPDDPRGSLRWSLSKLRKLVDHEVQRIVANRTSVRFEAYDAYIDVEALNSFSEHCESASIDQLKDAVSQFQGDLLEGLELSNFHTFHAWCVSKREEVARQQTKILKTLIQKLSNNPELALPYARELVAQSPYDEHARATLLKLLVSQGLSEEADQQLQQGLRFLREVGNENAHVLIEARRNKIKSQVLPRPAQLKSVNLIGRDLELSKLADHFSSDTPALLIQSSIGIGKTTLLNAHATRSAKEHKVLRSAAFETESFRPFAIWLDALTETSSLLDANPRNREVLFERIGQELEHKLNHQPLLLVFDDVQWCDESSAATLLYVCRRFRHKQLKVAMAARSTETRDNVALKQCIRELRRENLLTDLQLQPLEDAPMEHIVSHAFPEVDPKSIVRRAAGSPLFALELARVENASEVDSIEDLIQGRLAEFRLDEEEVLLWATVQAKNIQPEQIAVLSQLALETVLTTLEKAADRAILENHSGTYHFTHDLLAQGIYRTIPNTRRRIMHRLSAAQLQKKQQLDLEDASDLAFHAVQSGDALLAARSLLAAGRLNLKYLAFDDAAALARRGLTWVEELRDSDAVELTIELHEVLLYAAPESDWQEVADKYVELAEKALDNGSLSHARIGYHMASYVRWVHGQWTGAHEETLQAERVTRGASSDEQVKGLAETAKCLALIERDLHKADAMLMEAKAISSRSHQKHGVVFTGLGILRYFEGDYQQAIALLQEARTLCRAEGDRFGEYQSLEHLSMISIDSKNLDQIEYYSLELKELGQRIQNGSEGPFAEALALYPLYMQGEVEPMEVALQTLRNVDAKHRTAYILNRLALIDLAAGRSDDAKQKATEALHNASMLQRNSEILMAHLTLLESGREAGSIAEIDRLKKEPIAAYVRSRLP